jgi:hypothetical protein
VSDIVEVCVADCVEVVELFAVEVSVADVDELLVGIALTVAVAVLWAHR